MTWSEYNGQRISKRWEICADCKKHKRIESHHITPKSEGGEETIDLCIRCHDARHIKKEDFKRWGSKGGKATASNPANYMRNLKPFRDKWADHPPKEKPE